ncbi:MAG: hypothetical protein IJI88_05695 [Atopobiaceae bacterium]|nr:hypothetical protein [Olsenella sp.]MBQ6491748.1 hypothetical protein [Atopobiaceae bacterium]
MGQMHVMVLGAVMGLLGFLPSGILFELVLTRGKRVGVGAGLASVLVSFAFMSVAALAVRLLKHELTLVFGGAMACTFLAAWAVEAWRAWRDANAPASPGEGK